MLRQPAGSSFAACLHCAVCLSWLEQPLPPLSPPCISCQAKASLQYCAAFEAEPEEDEYDLLAAGEEGMTQQQEQQHNRNMQVWAELCNGAG